MLLITQTWPLLLRLAITVSAVGVACMLQLPIEPDVPGEPFLLFLLVVVFSALAFGANAGFVSAGLTTLLSIAFFDPYGLLTLRHAADLIKINLYALLAAGSVVAFARLANMLIVEAENVDRLKVSEESKIILLREMAHGVANNFASIAALIGLKSRTIQDVQAKSILDEAAELIKVMARVHRQLRSHERDMSLDSQSLLDGLCADLRALVQDRPISIECEAEDWQLSAEDATSLGLIVNELVTNAIKHAFPDGRRGSIRVRLDALGTQLHLEVVDDGVGFNWKHPSGGMGQHLLTGLSRKLCGSLELKTTGRGTSFHLSFPYKNSAPSAHTQPSLSVH